MLSETKELLSIVSKQKGGHIPAWLAKDASKRLEGTQPNTERAFESQTFVPCESGNCPEGLNEKHCPRIDNCPYGVQEESEAVNLWEVGRDSVADVEMRVRELLREGSDGVGHRVRWPQPAATRFAA